MSPRARLAPLALLALAACGHAPLAGRFHQRGPNALAEVTDVPVCGFDVTVELADDAPGGGGSYGGELLAATPQALTVLGARGLRTVPVASVKRVLVQVRPSHGGRAAGLTALGAVSTVTNGFFLVFTFPLWIVSGAAAAARGGTEDVTVGPATHEALPAYARFPQGLPPGWPPEGGTRPRCTPSPTDGRLEPRVDPAAPPPPAMSPPAAPPSPLPGAEWS